MLNHQPSGDFSPFLPLYAFLDISGNFRLSLSLNLFFPKRRRPKPPSSRFFSRLQALNENPEVQHQFLHYNSLLGVHLWDPRPKSRTDHESQKSGLNLNPLGIRIL